MPRQIRIWFLAGLVGLTLAAGCSRGPESSPLTSPATISAGGEPTLLASPRRLPSPQGYGSETRLIRARDGGEVQQGRFKVTIPPGALASDTYITVRDRSYLYVRCELEPHGTQFRAPVTFEIDLRGLCWAPYSDWSVFYHADDGTWEDEHGAFASGRVTAQLWHFSEYAPGADRGRAGW